MREIRRRVLDAMIKISFSRLGIERAGRREARAPIVHASKRGGPRAQPFDRLLTLTSTAFKSEILVSLQYRTAVPVQCNCDEGPNVHIRAPFSIIGAWIVCAIRYNGDGYCHRYFYPLPRRYFPWAKFSTSRKKTSQIEWTKSRAMPNNKIFYGVYSFIDFFQGLDAC